MVLVSGKHFVDEHGRRLTLRGINVAGASKMPANPPVTTFSPCDDVYWDGQNVSFVGRPFELDEADDHLLRIKSWGFNTIRYVYTWEALEHQGPGQYDDDFISYSIAVLRRMQHHGFHVFMDPHQDVWSRYSGGSGAPLWTFYAAGIDPKGFAETQAALVQNTWLPGPAQFPKMFWSTNYARLACQTMFTLFLAGRQFAPKCVINGVNIQDYLQDHMLAAMTYFYSRIMVETNLFDTTIFGVETMNELNMGFLGIEDVSKVPDSQQPKLGTCPSAFESMLLGSGYKTTVANYVFTQVGPQRKGSVTIDPCGTTIWMDKMSRQKLDDKFGWTRGRQWLGGVCIWAQHGVYDPDTLKVTDSLYFNRTSAGTLGSEDYFINEHFVSYWNRFYDTMRALPKPDLFLLCQPPTNSVPPRLVQDCHTALDTHVVYAPHFYDGLTLMLKRWSTVWNIDTLGILRGRYLSPVFGIKFGESNIRNCLRQQLQTIRKEGLDNLGQIPCLMSETGMPFDMDNRLAYRTGEYTSQIKALDAIQFALEGAGLNHTLWGYDAINRNAYGDFWNGEDFSFYSLDSLPTPDKSLGLDQDPFADPFSDPILDQASDQSSGSETTRLGSQMELHDKGSGMVRAEAAIHRPFPIAAAGDVVSHSFDLASRTFKLEIEAEDCGGQPTEIHVPLLHFDDPDISVSSGHYKLEGHVLKWWSGKGRQTMEMTQMQSNSGSCGCQVM